MARPPKNYEAAAELGEHLQAIKDAAKGNPTPKQIELWIWETFHARVSDESIRQAHAGDVDPTTCKFEILSGLVAFYGVEPPALGPHAARRFLVLAEMGDPELTPGIHVPLGSVQLGLFDLAA